MNPDPNAPRWVVHMGQVLREFDLSWDSKGWEVDLVLSHRRITGDWRMDLRDTIEAWAAADPQGATFLSRLVEERCWPIPEHGADLPAAERTDEPALFRRDA